MSLSSARAHPLIVTTNLPYSDQIQDATPKCTILFFLMYRYFKLTEMPYMYFIVLLVGIMIMHFLY